MVPSFSGGMHFSLPPHEGDMQLCGGEIHARYMGVFRFFFSCYKDFISKRRPERLLGEQKLTCLILRN